MDRYGISITTGGGDRRYRHGGQAEFDLVEAAELASELLERNTAAQYVTVGNGEHEFRSAGFRGHEPPAPRHADWYVDVEIGEQRWQYRPLADLDSYESADELAASAADELSEITRVWIGRSDGSEEYETEANS